MTHLNQDELILSYYREPDSGSHTEHLEACAECRAELDRLSRILDRLEPAPVPEPSDDYEARVWDRLQWRLRGERSRARRSGWMKYAAAAAIIAVAFIAGLLVSRRDAGVTTTATVAANTTQPPTLPASNGEAQQGRDRILLVVIGDHFDQSERILVELTNLTTADGADISAEQERAEELLASNRLYRRTALDRGEEKVATLLDELEPVLLQIARAPSQVSSGELEALQQRVETKELVFKLRILRAGVRATASPNAHRPTI